MQFMLCSIAHVIGKPILLEIRNSPTYTVMIDETTDLTVTSQMIMYIRYIDNKKKVSVNTINLLIHKSRHILCLLNIAN